MIAWIRHVRPATRLATGSLHWLGAVIPVLLVAIIGVGLSVYAFTTWRTFEATTAETNFRTTATARLANLRRSIAKPFNSILYVERLIELVGPINGLQFDRFAGEILRGNPEVSQLIWAPARAAGSGASFNATARGSRTILATNQVLPAGAGDIVGRDIGELPDYGACLNKALASTPNTDRACVVLADDGVDVIAIFAVPRPASYGDDTPGPASWVGAIAGRIHVRVSRTIDDGSSIDMFDLSAPGGIKSLLGGEQFDRGIDPFAAAGGVFMDLPLGSEAWRLANFPAPRATARPTMRSLLVLAACLAVTANLTGYILLILRRRQLNEAAVHDRTRELEIALSDLRLSEQRLQSYIATASDWYWETDGDFRFTRVAAQAREHRIESGDLIGLDRLTADDADSEVEQRRELLANHKMFRDLRYDYGSDRDLLTLSLSGLPIFGPDGTFLGYRGSARDVTLQLQVEARQRQARWTAEQASRAKSNFLATMSHEIRTPMNGVLGMLQLLSDTRLDEDQRRMCDVIYRSGHSLQQILNDILDYSKLEAGKITLEAIGSSLIDIVDSVVDLMRGTAEAKGLAIEVEMDDGGPPPVMIDPTRFRQVLFNLVSNAIKFSDQGIVTIRLNGTSDGPDAVAIKLEVADQGIGISVEARRRLFARFSQADGTTTRRYGGTGLGLAITRELVTLMGGTIGVSSVLGQGTTFTVRLTLPVAEPITPALLPPRWIEQPADARVLDILVAEDNDINQQVIRGLLRGHRLTMAGDGGEAVEAVRVGRFDVVLMDVMMPVMNGLEATGAIRALDSLPGTTVPIIALTANAMSGDRERYLSAGMNDYVSKPIERENLFRTIELVTGLTVWRPLAEALSPGPAAAVTREEAESVDDFIASLEM